jgi:hypothetical protein
VLRLGPHVLAFFPRSSDSFTQTLTYFGCNLPDSLTELVYLLLGSRHHGFAWSRLAGFVRGILRLRITVHYTESPADAGVSEDPLAGGSLEGAAR